MDEPLPYKCRIRTISVIAETLSRRSDEGEDQNEDQLPVIQDRLDFYVDLLSDPETRRVFDGMDWLEDVLLNTDTDLVLPQTCLDRLMILLGSDDLGIVRQAAHVIALSIAANAGTDHSILCPSLMNFIRAKFPDLGTTELCYDLGVSSSVSRDILIREGYCELILALFQSDNRDIYEIARLCASLVNWPLKVFEAILREIQDGQKISKPTVLGGLNPFPRMSAIQQLKLEE
jgi:hypothetical protein